MPTKKVLMVPDYRQGNPYQRLLAKALEPQGWQASFDHFTYNHLPFFLLLKQHKDIDVLHIHWITDIVKRITDSPSKMKFYLKLFMMVADCLIVRAHGVKIVWTIHNKLAHQQFDSKRELLIRKVLVKFTSQNIIHSNAALKKISELYQSDISKTTQVIFHGNYQGCYPLASNKVDNLRQKFNYQQDDIIILYFGLIRPYKGLDTLITSFNKAVNPKVKLLIAGASKDEAYLEKLTALAKNNANITMDIRFLPDQELVDYLAIANTVVLPFSDTLTSGSTILAMTSGKALIVPESAKVFGCIPDSGVKYFSSSAELTNIIGQMNQDELNAMGEHNAVQAATMSWDKVGTLTSKVYDNI